MNNNLCNGISGLSVEISFLAAAVLGVLFFLRPAQETTGALDTSSESYLSFFVKCAVFCASRTATFQRAAKRAGGYQFLPSGVLGPEK